LAALYRAFDAVELPSFAQVEARVDGVIAPVMREAVSLRSTCPLEATWHAGRHRATVLGMRCRHGEVDVARPQHPMHGDGRRCSCRVRIASHARHRQ
jgi:hypothetical protein